MRIVHKYGGSSVASIEQIKSIANHLKILYEKGNEIVVVLSAMGKTTDSLINEANIASNKPNKRDLDLLLATGEIKSIALLSIILNSLNVPSIALTGFQAGFKTNSDYSRAFIIDLNIERIKKELKNKKIVVVAGFQGVDEFNNITTFGRGGSDTTAVAIAAKLNCDCEIYTDVESVFSIDPRVYKNAKKIHKITYDEMMEMAVSGAKVLDPRSVELAKKFGVKLYLGKTLEKDKSKGTFVMENNTYLEEMPIKSLALKHNMEFISIKISINNLNLLSEIFKILVNNKVNYEMLSVNEVKDYNVFSFIVGISDAEKIKKDILNSEFINLIELVEKKDIVKIVLLGIGFSTHTKIAKDVFELLNKNNINYSNILISELSLSFTIKEEDSEKVVEVLAKSYKL